MPIPENFAWGGGGVSCKFIKLCKTNFLHIKKFFLLPTFSPLGRNLKKENQKSRMWQNLPPISSTTFLFWRMIHFLLIINMVDMFISKYLIPSREIYIKHQCGTDILK